jgi:Chalcone isomerase-like
MKSVFLSLIAALSVIIPHSGMANTEVLTPYFSAAKPIGDGRLSYMFWDIYDATLYAPQGKWSENKPFALKLTYLIDVKGKKIATLSIEEIKKQGFQDSQKLTRWEKEMTTIFPDMGAGTSIIGIRTKAGNTVFYKDNRHIGSITDPVFTQKFFDIWLSPKTSKPALRQNLLGRK